VERPESITTAGATAEAFPFSERQVSLLAHWRAWWEEGEERFQHWEQRAQDLEVSTSFRLILQSNDFPAGSDLTVTQLDRLCALARRVAPNKNLDRRLYTGPEEPHAFNRLLRNLLYSDRPLILRITEFLKRKGVGEQTVTQLLCLAWPERCAIISPGVRAALASLQLTPEQDQILERTARSEYGVEDVQGQSSVLGMAKTLALLGEVKNELECESHLELYRVLQSSPREGKGLLAVTGRALPAVAREDRARYRAARSFAPHNVTEQEVLAALEAHAAARGFTYPHFALRSYYVALRTKPFVILSGISGTGKTRLTHLFAEFLTGDASNQYRVLPVRPDWTDPSALLGYTNLLAGPEGRYVSTTFLDFVREAGRPENRRKAYFVCLDEMNLARVEYYLADLLSAMETPEREILLHGPRGDATVRIPANLFLTGTVNVDETTHTFSRKVLDRANVMELGAADLAAFGGSDSAQSELGEDKERLQEIFLSARTRTVRDALDRLAVVTPGLSDRTVDLLVRLNNALSSADLGFGYRVRDEVLIYLSNSYDSQGAGLFDPDPQRNGLIALDLQVLQKVLPRLSGATEQIEPALRAVLAELLPGGRPLPQGICGDVPSLLNLAEAAELPRSCRKLVRLLVRLQRDGFVTFYEG
jgi:hypothetical protein